MIFAHCKPSNFSNTFKNCKKHLSRICPTALKHSSSYWRQMLPSSTFFSRLKNISPKYPSRRFLNMYSELLSKILSLSRPHNFAKCLLIFVNMRRRPFKSLTITVCSIQFNDVINAAFSGILTEKLNCGPGLLPTVSQ